MASWTWEFGAAGSGVHFTIVYDTATSSFTVTSMEGEFDLNALWWDDGVDDGTGVKLAKSDSSLNMNGSGATDWDGMAKLSSSGLGSEGEDKPSFISEGETAVFSLADFGITGMFDPASGGTLGVRATSVNGGDSFKLVDTTPEWDPDTPQDDFPIWPQDISNIVLYFQQDDGDTKPNPDGDGFYTVKIDGVSGAPDDLDDWIADVLTYLVANDPNIDADSDLLGVAIKGGNVAGSTQYFAYGDHNTNGTDADVIPDGAPLIEYDNPAQGQVPGPYIDATFDYDLLF